MTVRSNLLKFKCNKPSIINRAVAFYLKIYLLRQNKYSVSQNKTAVGFPSRHSILLIGNYIYQTKNNLELMRCFMAKQDPAKIFTNSDHSQEAELVLERLAVHKNIEISDIIREALLHYWQEKMNLTLFVERVADDWLTVNMRIW